MAQLIGIQRKVRVRFLVPYRVQLMLAKLISGASRPAKVIIVALAQLLLEIDIRADVGQTDVFDLGWVFARTGRTLILSDHQSFLVYHVD